MSSQNPMNQPLIETFKKYFTTAPKWISVAPGRVNLLGEHVDYNDGFVLPAAIDRRVQVAASAIPEPLVTLVAVDLDKRITFHLSDLQEKIDNHGQPLPRWARYPAGVAWALGAAGVQVKGIQAVFSSDVPIGAGLSSSAAVEVAFAALWTAFHGQPHDRLELARLCQKAENQYVGVNCGLMDQFASACGVADHALFFDTRSLEWEAAPLPSNTAIIIADSGMRRSLVESAYNERRRSCEQAVEILKRFLPAIRSLRDVSTVEFAAYSTELPEEIRKRAEHVVKEIHRVEAAMAPLRRDDGRAFGALMFAGHKSLRDLYEVSTPELDTLVELARGLPGIIGARLTGAGFGGCTVNLVETQQAQVFMEGLKDGYAKSTGKQAQVYLCHASEGVKTYKI